MEKCCFIHCDKEATTKGFVYGRYKGEDKSDSLIPVVACDIHKKMNSFFPNVEQKGGNK